MQNSNRVFTLTQWWCHKGWRTYLYMRTRAWGFCFSTAIVNMMFDLSLVLLIYYLLYLCICSSQDCNHHSLFICPAIHRNLQKFPMLTWVIYDAQYKCSISHSWTLPYRLDIVLHNKSFLESFDGAIRKGVPMCCPTLTWFSGTVEYGKLETWCVQCNIGYYTICNRWCWTWF